MDEIVDGVLGHDNPNNKKIKQLIDFVNIWPQYAESYGFICCRERKENQVREIVIVSFLHKIKWNP